MKASLPLSLLGSVLFPYLSISALIRFHPADTLLALSIAFPVVVLSEAALVFWAKASVEKWYSNLSETGKDKTGLVIAAVAITSAYGIIFFREWVAITNRLGIYYDLGFQGAIVIQPVILLIASTPYVMLFYAYRSLGEH